MSQLKIGQHINTVFLCSDVQKTGAIPSTMIFNNPRCDRMHTKKPTTGFVLRLVN